MLDNGEAGKRAVSRCDVYAPVMLGCDSLRMPRRWSVNVPGMLMETLPAKSRKSMLFSMQ